MRILPGMATLATVLAVAGCSDDTSRAGVSDDPYESANRSSYASHQILYRNDIRPVVVFYNDAVPEPARDGVHNFLVNIDLPVTFGNDLLQGKIVGGGETLARFTINSTVGIGGLVDVARKIGIPEHETGFADTMADYGVGEGPYLYVPVIGPSVPRELAGKLVDTAFDPLTYVTYGASIFVSVGRAGATYVDKRSRGAATADEIEKISRDPYATTRTLYQKHLAAEADFSATTPDFDDEPADVRLAAQQSQETVSSAAPSDSQDVGGHCSSVAALRASDAAASGYESDMQKIVRDSVYKDCMSWRVVHGGAGAISGHAVALQ